MKLLIDNRTRPGGGTEHGVSSLENRRECPTRFALDQARKADFQAMRDSGQEIPEGDSDLTGLHSGTLHHYYMRALVEGHVDPSQEIEFELEDPLAADVKQADREVVRKCSLYTWRKLYACLKKPLLGAEVQMQAEIAPGFTLTGAVDAYGDLDQDEADAIGLAFMRVGLVKPGSAIFDWKLLKYLNGIFGAQKHVYGHQWLSYYVLAARVLGKKPDNFIFCCTQRSDVKPPREPNIACGIWPKELPSIKSAEKVLTDLHRDGLGLSPYNLKACFSGGKLCRHALESGGKCDMGLDMFDMDGLLGG